MAIVLALDLGTTGNRAIAFDDSGRIVAQDYHEFTQYYPHPGWVEHDPVEILDSVLSVLVAVATQVGVDRISAIGITNQRETTVVWDAETGIPVHRAIVWQCRRTSDYCRSLKAHELMIKSKTGLPLDAYFSASKIRWTLDHVDGAIERSQAGGLLFGTIDAWIVWNLTGRRVHATDVSNASRTLLFNIHTGDYDPELTQLFGVPEAMLPEVRASNAEFGVLDADVIGKALPITGVLGDQQAALFAQGGYQPGIVKNTYGTGLFLMTSTGSTVAESPDLATTIAWMIGDEIHYALEGSVFVGGSAVQWLRDGLELIDDASETDALAQSVEDTGGVVFVPALTGLGAPHWDSTARGLLVGLTRGVKRAHIVRAALESIALQTYDIALILQKTHSGSLDVLRADGGATANQFLMQFQADLLGVPVEIPTVAESTAYGVALMAGIGAGIWTLEALPDLIGTSRRYDPQPLPNKSKILSDWNRAIERSRHWIET